MPTSSALPPAPDASASSPCSSSWPPLPKTVACLCESLIIDQDAVQGIVWGNYNLQGPDKQVVALRYRPPSSGEALESSETEEDAPQNQEDTEDKDTGALEALVVDKGMANPRWVQLPLNAALGVLEDAWNKRLAAERERAEEAEFLNQNGLAHERSEREALQKVTFDGLTALMEAVEAETKRAKKDVDTLRREGKQALSGAIQSVLEGAGTKYFQAKGFFSLSSSREVGEDTNTKETTGWARALGEGAVAIGESAEASGNNNVALGAFASVEGHPDIVTSTQIGGVTYNFSGASEAVGIVSLGKEGRGGPQILPQTRQLQYVAPGRLGEASLDAVNGSQLWAVRQAAAQAHDNNASERARAMAAEAELAATDALIAAGLSQVSGRVETNATQIKANLERALGVEKSLQDSITADRKAAQSGIASNANAISTLGEDVARNNVRGTYGLLQGELPVKALKYSATPQPLVAACVANDAETDPAQRESWVALATSQELTDALQKGKAAKDDVERDLRSEAERAQKAESQNAQDIVKDRNRAIAAEAEIRKDLTAEKNRAAGAESRLGEEIDRTREALQNAMAVLEGNVVYGLPSAPPAPQEQGPQDAQTPTTPPLPIPEGAAGALLYYDSNTSANPSAGKGKAPYFQTRDPSVFSGYLATQTWVEAQGYQTEGQVIAQLTDTLRYYVSTRDFDEKLEDYAKIISPTFLGNPQAPTASLGNNSNTIATTAFVQDNVAAAIAKSGGAATSAYFKGTDIVQYAAKPTPAYVPNGAVGTVAAGSKAIAGRDYATAIGASSGAGEGSTVLGYNAQGSNGAIAIGANVGIDIVFAAPPNTIAIGNNAKANNGNSVAIGQDATTQKAEYIPPNYINGVKYTPGGSQPVGAVSFGLPDQCRQLQNVAAGRVLGSSTDAVNGSQLWAVLDQLNTVIRACVNAGILKPSGGGG